MNAVANMQQKCKMREVGINSDGMEIQKNCSGKVGKVGKLRVDFAKFVKFVKQFFIKKMHGRYWRYRQKRQYRHAKIYIEMTTNLGK